MVGIGNFLNKITIGRHERNIKSFRLFREKLMGDTFRPGYHFAIPDDIGRPGDPNGAFFARGRYHLMYLYKRRGVGFCWGHISSHDLLHWVHHPDAIGPGEGDLGCFSGGAFVKKNKDGKLTAYLTYWRMPDDKGIGIAKSSDLYFEKWEKLPKSAIEATEWGIFKDKDEQGNDIIRACADPSNIWEKDGTYYMQAGNLIVLNNFGRDKSSPYFGKMRGDWVDLYESEDLIKWNYVHRFYEYQNKSDETDFGWPDVSEDDMCPSFLPLPSDPNGGVFSGKYLQLFISHNKGCQYYIGTYDKSNDKFIPEKHGRMTWNDNTFFAPEALIDDKGRQIMWAWLLDNPFGDQKAVSAGWCGVYGLPRSLWLGDDGNLMMRVPEEFEHLRSQEQSWYDLTLQNDAKKKLDIVNGRSCEIFLKIDTENAEKVGIMVRTSNDLSEKTLLYYDVKDENLVFDATSSSKDQSLGRPIKETAPFRLNSKEKLRLRVFIDNSVIELFANDRQAITRRVFPTEKENADIYVYFSGEKAKFEEIKAWDVAPTNPY